MNDQTKRISTFFPRAEAYLLSIPKEGGVPFKRPASKRQTTERVVFILCATSVCESFCCILNSIAFCKALNSSSDSSYALANSGSFICSLKNSSCVIEAHLTILINLRHSFNCQIQILFGSLCRFLVKVRNTISSSSFTFRNSEFYSDSFPCIRSRP